MRCRVRVVQGVVRGRCRVSLVQGECRSVVQECGSQMWCGAIVVHTGVVQCGVRFVASLPGL